MKSTKAERMRRVVQQKKHRLTVIPAAKKEHVVIYDPDMIEVGENYNSATVKERGSNR